MRIGEALEFEGCGKENDGGGCREMVSRHRLRSGRRGVLGHGVSQGLGRGIERRGEFCHLDRIGLGVADELRERAQEDYGRLHDFGHARHARGQRGQVNGHAVHLSLNGSRDGEHLVYLLFHLRRILRLEVVVHINSQVNGALLSSWISSPQDPRRLAGFLVDHVHPRAGARQKLLRE